MNWLRRSNAELTRRDELLVAECARAVRSSTEPADFHAAVATQFQHLSGARGTIVCEYRPAADDFHTVAYAGTVPGNPSMKVSAKGSLARWLRVNEQCLAIGSRGPLADYLDSREREQLAQLGVTLCIPLCSLTSLTGLILLSSNDPAWLPVSRELALFLRCAREVANAYDVMSLHRAEHTRRERMHRTEKMAVAGQLASAIAHEVRNPLTAIRSSIQYLVEHKVDQADAPDLLRLVLAEVDRIDGTISGLLTLRRSPDMAQTGLELMHVIEEAVALVRSYTHSRGIEIILDPCDEAPIVAGDAHALRQVFLNLLFNACDALSSPGTITIRCRRESAAGERDTEVPMVHVEIVDNGSGISSDLLEQVFEPFFTTKPTGTGLGLPISREIIQRHGGQLALSSAQNVGTAAHIRLPTVSDSDA